MCGWSSAANLPLMITAGPGIGVPPSMVPPVVPGMGMMAPGLGVPHAGMPFMPQQPFFPQY